MSIQISILEMTSAQFNENMSLDPFDFAQPENKSLDMTEQRKRLLLFDIDGTLIHSGGAGVHALKLTLAERFKIADDLHDIEIAGMTDSGIVASILQKHKIPATNENITAFLDSYVHFLSRELPRRKGNLLPGVLELLQKLKSRKHLVLALLTGNVSRGAQLKLEHYGVWHFFEIDLHVSPNVTVSLNMMIEKKPKQLIVDLGRVTYIDSSGLAALIEGMQNVQEYDGKFALTGLQEPVRTIFEIARLDQVFQIFPDVGAAVAAV